MAKTDAFGHLLERRSDGLYNCLVCDKVLNIHPSLDIQLDRPEYILIADCICGGYFVEQRISDGKIIESIIFCELEKQSVDEIIRANIIKEARLLWHDTAFMSFQKFYADCSLKDRISSTGKLIDWFMDNSDKYPIQCEAYEKWARRVLEEYESQKQRIVNPADDHKTRQIYTGVR